MFTKVKVKNRPKKRAAAGRDDGAGGCSSTAAIDLACKIALMMDTCHERFRFAWDCAHPGLGTLGGFAKRLGIHPSSLTRTNFKMNPGRRRAAAKLLRVSAKFLVVGVKAADDLPDVLRAPYQVAITILALAKRPGQGRTATWTHEAALINLRPASVRSKFGGHDRQLITAIHRVLAEHAAHQLERCATITLSLSAWSAIIDLLVSDALANAPENLQHQRMQLACQLHRSLADGVQT